MKTRFVAPLVALAVASVGVAVSGGVALAHGTHIEAEAICDETGQPVIEFFSESWSTLQEGENPRIDISFDGVVVFSGAYVMPDNAFSGSAPAPAGKGAGDDVWVTAEAVGNWGNGADGGQTASVLVTIPDQDCGGEVDPALG